MAMREEGVGLETPRLSVSQKRHDQLNFGTQESESDQKFTDQKAQMNATAGFGDKASKFRSANQAGRL